MCSLSQICVFSPRSERMSFNEQTGQWLCIIAAAWVRWVVTRYRLGLYDSMWNFQQTLIQTAARNRFIMTEVTENQFLLLIREVVDSILGPDNGHPEAYHHSLSPFGQILRWYLKLRHKGFLLPPFPTDPSSRIMMRTSWSSGQHPCFVFRWPWITFST